MQPVDVIGMGADGLASIRPELVERIRAAEFLAGGERQLALFPETRGMRFVIKDNLSDLLLSLDEHHERRCVVLASGDPLFYGIGRFLINSGRMRTWRIEPAISSMQLAFARAAIPWQEAAVASIHGRDLRATLLPLLGRCVIGLFTLDGDSPAAVATFFLERGLDDHEAFVAENLGASDERCTHWPDLTALTEQRFAPLNYLILRRKWTSGGRHLSSRLRSMVPGVPYGFFLRPVEGPDVMTGQEIRSVVLGKLHLTLQPGDMVWDVGAGLGTVSIEVAVLRPDLEVVAIENDSARASVLRENRDLFDAWNVRVIEGKAPEALATELLAPSRVFIGGSGGNLAGILDLVRERLPIHGIVVANFVTLEHLMLALKRLKSWDWPFEITEVHVSRSDSLAGLTGLQPQRGVFIVSAQKRKRDHV